jgi:hypothetical protein
MSFIEIQSGISKKPRNTESKQSFKNRPEFSYIKIPQYFPPISREKLSLPFDTLEQSKQITVK